MSNPVSNPVSNQVWMFQQYGRPVLQRLVAQYSGADAATEGAPIHLEDLCEPTGGAPSDSNWFDGPVVGMPHPPALNTLPEPQDAPPPSYERGQKRAHSDSADSVKNYIVRVQEQYRELGDLIAELADKPENSQVLAQMGEEFAVSLIGDIAETQFPKKPRVSAKAAMVAKELAAQKTITRTARESLKAVQRAALEATADLAKETEILAAKQEELDLAIATGNDVSNLDRLRKVRREPAPLFAAWARDAVNKHNQN